MLGAKLDSTAYLKTLQETIEQTDHAALRRWSDAVYQAWEQQQTVFIIGNGGSATTASHMSEDLAKSTLKPEDLTDEKRRRLRVLSLTDNVGWMTAIANDLAYEDVFVQQLMNIAQDGDLLIAISGSGNSPNVLKAIQWATQHRINTFGITGFDGGRLMRIQQDGVNVSIDDMGMVESVHLSLFHWVLNDVYARINRLGRHA